MPALPVDLPAEFDKHDEAKIVYKQCLLAQAYYENRRTEPDTRQALICVRIVGYILLYSPSEIGVATILREIMSCKDHGALRDLGYQYQSAWIWAFKAAKGRTPAASSHASRPSFDTLADMINDHLDPAPQSHASAKRSALVRDGFRCVLTGKYDLKSFNKNLHLQSHDLDWDATTETECAHIFSEFTNFDIEPGSDKRSWAASMWAVMSRFGYTKIPEELNGAKIHRLENVLTLDVTVRRLFDSLQLWFVATDRKNVYKVEVTPEYDRLKRKYPTVTFQSSKDDLPPPSPEYLAIHAACCKVAYVSGASLWFQEFEDERDNHRHKTLANDGTSADILYGALYAHALTGDAMA